MNGGKQALSPSFRWGGCFLVCEKKIGQNREIQSNQMRFLANGMMILPLSILITITLLKYSKFIYFNIDTNVRLVLVLS